MPAVSGGEIHREDTDNQEGPEVEELDSAREEIYREEDDYSGQCPVVEDVNNARGEISREEFQKRVEIDIERTPIFSCPHPVCNVLHTPGSDQGVSPINFRDGDLVGQDSAPVDDVGAGQGSLREAVTSEPARFFTECPSPLFPMHMRRLAPLGEESESSISKRRNITTCDSASTEPFGRILFPESHRIIDTPGGGQMAVTPGVMRFYR